MVSIPVGTKRKKKTWKKRRRKNSGGSGASRSRITVRNTGRAHVAVLTRVGQVFAFIGAFLAVLLLTVFLMLKIFVNCSEASRNLFITTVLETGQLKFLASLCLSESEINEVINKNSMKEFDDTEINEGMINITVSDDINAPDDAAETMKDVEIDTFAGLTYKATIMIIRDPSRLSVATICQGNDTWPEYGIDLHEIIEADGGIGGINGGLFNSYENTGGSPCGVVVEKGKIVRNRPYEAGGLVLIGLSESNILQILDIKGMSPADVEQLVAEKKIRDAVCFQEQQTYDNNHFVFLIVNGKEREISGQGSGLNPRTAIGQREDGSLILVVTDGRGQSGHAGASAADLVEIMKRYGAVNAANLDGGSSTSMYYQGKYLQTSVTFYFSNASWNLPTAFVLK